MPPPRVLILRLYVSADDAAVAPVLVCEDPATGRQTPFDSAETLWGIVQACLSAGPGPRTATRTAASGAGGSQPPTKESP